jgi:hypothetical protein
MLLVAAFFCGAEKVCTLPDHAYRCDASRTTFLHHQGVRRVSSSSDLRIAFHGMVSSTVSLISSFRGVDLPVILFS